MLDLLTQISAPLFLPFFILFSITCICISWFWIRSSDNSTQYQVPALTALTPFEISVLRNGCKGVIHTALFKLWQNQQIAVSSREDKTEIKSVVSNPPENQCEKIIFNFITPKARAPYEFFQDPLLHNQLDEVVKPINQQLETLHLKKTQLQRKKNAKVLWVTLGLIWAVGGGSFLLDFHEMLLLIFPLIVITMVAIIALAPRENTQLGRKYLKKLTKHYKSLKKPKTIQVDPLWLVAVLGVEGLTGLAIYSPFQKAFAETSAETIGSTSDYSGDSGWDSSDSGNGGGGGG